MGDGAFSNVYKAVERKTGRKVAVKVVRKYELNSSQVRPVSNDPSDLFLVVLAVHPPDLLCRLPRPGQAGIKAAGSVSQNCFRSLLL